MQRKSKKVFKEPILCTHERDCYNYEGETLKAHTKLVEAKIPFQLVPVEDVGQPVLYDEKAKAWNGLMGIEDYIRSYQQRS
ncbi:hypothetical protein A3C77_01550 [Candidatus Giovannonibacteria bacterium RIFCSPHIGHO2_02_FULL_45_13]|uniref:Uncharacterized protein n=1 Tax=Candidatus Giovannonibacteria bacterium RIFCSPHIGHO2_01_FULL_45_23 TaxID=1798325 RepID=A0A1F5VJG4_9BACT|nr:MAG: hypothetical protein A2834_04590 [Candidatus Giovannonibacteria bacterium RIFCSPHIGHO2_01_FULL_45_23]OGF76444.1 MAG: hypothetical protein A3C77_01550 [Candidatus Giovannonibacteria bacterium RIFCSPHIGHO2_02_FULL_45_13]